MSISSSQSGPIEITTGTDITISSLEIQDNTQITVTKISALGDPSVLVLDTDYTVSADLATVVLNTTLSTDERAIVTLAVELTQETEFLPFSTINVEIIEEALDKLTLVCKQLSEVSGRNITLKLQDHAFDPEIPSISGNANMYLRVNENEDGFEWNSTSVTSTGLDDVVEDTSPSLGGDLDANGNNILFDDNTGIKDDSGNEQLTFQKTTTAVNQFEMTNAATGNSPLLSVAGGDTNISLSMQCKGSGTFNMFGTASGAAELRLYEDSDNGSNYLGLKAASNMASSITYSFPATALDGGVLVMDSAGQMYVRPFRQYTTISSSSGVLTLDLSVAEFFVCTMTENITSIVISNMPTTPANQAIEIYLDLIQHASSAKTLSYDTAQYLIQDGTPATVSSTLNSHNLLRMFTLSEGSTFLINYGTAYI